MATVYKYVTGGRAVDYVDENDEYKPDDIRQHWAQTFPELSNATWDEGKDEEGRKVITFAKKVGTKGGGICLTALIDGERWGLFPAEFTEDELAPYRPIFEQFGLAEFEAGVAVKFRTDMTKERVIALLDLALQKSKELATEGQ